MKTENRPLVTFALFGYNQEKFIRDAVAGALAQTYQPLQIILSDDCSTDRTFAIMSELANGYQGPHRVIARQNAFNLGTALHVQSVFLEADGMLMVVAAGDDISVAERVSTLFNAWADAGFPEGLLHSGRESFSEDTGDARVFPAKRAFRSASAIKGYARSHWLPAAAPTCAYTRGVFERFPALMGGSIIEDAPLQFRAALLGAVIACNEPLVRQRLHSANTGTGYNFDSPARWNRFIQSKIVAFRNMQRDLAVWDRNLDVDLRRAIENRFLRVLRSAAGLFLPEVHPPSLFDRLTLAQRICMSPAVARTFRLRVEYALTFFGFKLHLSIKRVVRAWLVRGERHEVS